MLLNNGNGAFPANQIFGNSGGYWVAVADFNGDGIPDLATANFPLCSYCGYADSVSILLGNGNGTYRPHVDYATGSAIDVAAADLNGDGRVDLVTANLLDNTISVLLGNGDGSFQTSAEYATAAVPISARVGDFNGDGIPDIAVATFLFPEVSILLGNGDGTFRPRVDYTAASFPLSVVVADFNHDGKLDLAAAGPSDNFGQTPGQVSILLGNGDGTFQPYKSYAVNQAVGVAMADFDGDGNTDLVVSNGFFRCATDYSVCNDDSNVSILLGNGDGTLKAAVNYDTANGPWGVATGDLDGDGIPDIVTANVSMTEVGGISGSTVSVLWGNGDGTFRPHVEYIVGFSPFSIAIADLNGDSKNDVAVAVGNSETVVPLLNTGNGPADILSIDAPGTCAGPKHTASSESRTNMAPRSGSV